MTESKNQNGSNAPIELPPKLTVADLSVILKRTPVETIKELMRQGQMLSMNQEVGLDSARKVAARFGVAIKKPRQKELSTATRVNIGKDDSQNLKPKPPIITITGHVDHGKTTLLDTIQGTKLTERERGGITQGIGAYPIKHKGQSITVIDTPGHAAFTAMRASGVRVTDVNVLVIAADDGVMPQTIEAIDHAKAAGVPLVVAINKIDIDRADPEKIKFQLSENGVMVEELGGDTVVVQISALKGDGVDDLMEAILLVAEVSEIKADFERAALGVVLESRVDRKRGTLISVIIRTGVLRIGDAFIAGDTRGKVRAMADGLGEPIKIAEPGTAVQILGSAGLPGLGSKFEVVENEQAAKQLIEIRHTLDAGQRRAKRNTTMDDFKRDQAIKGLEVIELIVKAGTQGELEAVRNAITGLRPEKAAISILHAGVGAVNESDVLLASTAGHTVMAFNSPVEKTARSESKRLGVQIYTNEIIYKLLDEIETIIEKVMEPKKVADYLGMAVVQAIFDHGKRHKIAGVILKEGFIRRNSKIKVMRDEEQIFSGRIKSMNHVREKVNEIKNGSEGGILLDGFNDYEVGDKLICEKETRS